MKNQYKQLTLKERYQIETLSKRNLSGRSIAKHLKRSNKAISNELQRCVHGHYCGETVFMRYM
ncbi:helix-turn-helix domain-containing protein [Shewanella surugensis]|uniref:helix-turn-helix domain-containing protein n=1 Tax=Shewanella surugensis TaxID=212020 RepID=UPI0035E0CA4C